MPLLGSSNHLLHSLAAAPCTAADNQTCNGMQACSSDIINKVFFSSPAQVLMHNSRQLHDAATLTQAGVTAGATLSVSSRLRGGGGDGGSTGAESRSCYLEMYAEKKPDKVSSSAVSSVHWQLCSRPACLFQHRRQLLQRMQQQETCCMS